LQCDARTARDDASDDLVPGDERRPVRLQLALDDMKIGAAHAAGRDAEQNRAVARLGNIALLDA